MSREVITVVISKDGGQVTTDVEGVKGKRCLDITKALEDAIGTVQSRTEKGEMLERSDDIHDVTKVGT